MGVKETTAFWVWDRVPWSAYIDRDYPTRAAAEQVMNDLLAPYPAGHMWRERLLVIERRVAEGKEP